MAVKISIDGDGLNYNGETNLHKAAQIIAFIGTEQNNLQTGNSSNQNEKTLMSLSNTQSNITPRQLINEAEAKTNIQKIAVIAKYLKDRNQDAFVRNEIVEQFRRAGEASPKNIGRDLRETVIMGYICERTEQRGEYYLTHEGEIAISEKFSGGKENKKNKSKAKNKKAKNTQIEPSNISLKDLMFTPKIDGIPGYWDMKKSDRIHWILFAVKSQNINEMTNKDIEYVAKRLEDNILSSTVDAFSKVNRKLNYLNKNGTTYRILQPGIEHLQSLLTSNQNGKEGK